MGTSKSTILNMASMIVSPSEFKPSKHIIYTKAKVNSKGGKSIGNLNSETKRSLKLSTPLMLNYGAQRWDNEDGSYKLTMALQFPREEFSNEDTTQLLNTMKEFESQVKDDAVKNSKEWCGKVKSKEVIEELWNPILKYRKNTEGEPDYTSSPTLQLKLPVWDGEYNFELFDPDNQLLLPNSSGATPEQLVEKGSNIAGTIQCGGIWFANGNFGVTWKLNQGIIKRIEKAEKGKCYVKLSSNDRDEIGNDRSEDFKEEKENSVNVEDSEEEEEEENVVESANESTSDDVEGEEEVPDSVAEPEPEPKPEPEFEPEPEVKPKKKRVVK